MGEGRRGVRKNGGKGKFLGCGLVEGVEGVRKVGRMRGEGLGGGEVKGEEGGLGM